MTLMKRVVRINNSKRTQDTSEMGTDFINKQYKDVYRDMILKVINSMDFTK